MISIGSAVSPFVFIRPTDVLWECSKMSPEIMSFSRDLISHTPQGILENRRHSRFFFFSHACVLWKSCYLPKHSNLQVVKSLVNLKGDQPWIFTGRTDAEAETPVFWLPDVNRQLTGKVPDAGKDRGQKEKRASEDEMAGWHHWSNEHELGQTPGDS